MSPELDELTYLVSIYVMERVSADPKKGFGFAHASSLLHAAQFEAEFNRALKILLSKIPEVEHDYDVIKKIVIERNCGDEIVPERVKIIEDLLTRIGLASKAQKLQSAIRPEAFTDPYAGLNVLTPLD